MKFLRTYESIEMKICSWCGESKSVSEFFKKGNSTRPECKSCSGKWNKEYRKNNIDKIRERKRKYRQTPKGKEVDKKSADKYRKNTPLEVKDKLKQSHKAWCNNQYKTNSKYKLTVSIRTLIGRSFRGKIKPKKTEDILGCSIEDFRIYIQNQFTDGMNWENQGMWHLDHIVPISWAKNEEEVIEFNHYTNFKPMWGIENIKKGNRFSEKRR